MQQASERILYWHRISRYPKAVLSGSLLNSHVMINNWSGAGIALYCASSNLFHLLKLESNLLLGRAFEIVHFKLGTV